MNQALYRKYRSKKLSEIVGQEHITTTLRNALKQGKISHAYLLTGPKGVGKTSVARILAHDINDLPYTDDSTHLDIIEIDAASNRRIDEIRDLRDKVHISPSSAKYKVYIIDEVHMLTKEAFNALLKTLEEPPAHVVFILATTEAHKLPATIISRTQRLQFNTVSVDEVVKHLSEIAKLEKFQVEPQALKLIAEYGEGSFRDSIGLLDQVANGKKGAVTADDVRLVTGHAAHELIDQVVRAVERGQQSDVLSALQSARTEGVSPKAFAHQLITALRSQAIDRQLDASQLALMQALLTVEHSSQPDIALELILLQASLDQQPVDRPAPTASPVPVVKEAKPAKAPAPAPPAVEVKPEAPAEPEPPKPKASPKTTQAQLPQSDAATPAGSATARPFSQDIWISLLASVKSSNPSLYSVLRMAEAQQEDGGLVLHLKHSFHAKRLSDAKNQQLVADLLKTLLGASTKVTAIHDADAQPTVTTAVLPAADATSIEAQQEPDPGVATILETFGGGEVVDV